MKLHTTLRPGCLAYIDSFAGLVPCKVLAIGTERVRVNITATRGAYKRGTDSEHARSVIIPRGAVYVRGGQYRIAAYSIENTRE